MQIVVYDVDLVCVSLLRLSSGFGIHEIWLTPAALATIKTPGMNDIW